MAHLSNCSNCGSRIINSPLCKVCGDPKFIALQDRIKDLEVENKRMKELKCPPISDGDNCICPIEELETILIKKDERIEELEDALVRIDNWAKAYPLEVFPKPDLKKTARVLKAAGMTLDAISADAMRHVIEGVKDITEQALKG